MAQNIFERHEKKYLFSQKHQHILLEQLQPYMQNDEYGTYAISNLYYDTPQYDLIRTSIEKPVYKEKLRIRSYGQTEANSIVFVELKKKYQGVVYKRRVPLPYAQAKKFLNTGTFFEEPTQILYEIQHFLTRYPLSEAIFLCYNRTALCGRSDTQLRITFDTDIRFRNQNLRLDSGSFGTEILPPGFVLMELKFVGALPLWLSKMLSQNHIFPTSFSKYGTCYQQHILPGLLQKEVSISA